MFEGTYTALVTPFSEPVGGAKPEIDYPALENLLEWQISTGISGFVIGGTTGESATLAAEERLSLLTRVMDVVSNRVPVIAGTGSNDTRQSIEMTRAAKELKVAGALIVSPYYNKPTQAGLYAHFEAVAREGGLPVVLYNIPGRSAVDIAVPTFERLAKVENVVAVKEASGSADKLMMLVEAVGSEIAILSGEDSLTYLFMAVGGKGVISASANVIPELMSEIVTEGLAENFDASLAAQVKALPVIRALFAETNPAPAKAALELMGKMPRDTMRLPLVPVTEDTRKLLSSVLK